MSASNVVAALMVGALWYSAMTSRLHNWRAIGFLVLVSGGFLAAGWLPPPVQLWSRAFIWFAGMVVLLFWGHLVSAMAHDEYSFVQQYLLARARISRLKSRAMETPSAQYVAEFSTIVDSFEELKPPPGEWASLHSDAVAELKRRLAMMKLLSEAPVTALAAAEAQWASIERRFDSRLRSRTGLWAN